MPETEYKDIEITCLCGIKFIYTAGAQKFMYDLKLRGEIVSISRPKRCISCRRKNKERRMNEDLNKELND